MCHRATRWVLAGLLVASAAAQPVDWRRIGNSTVELMLASPATGPVERVWFSADGDRLYARTHSGRTFVSLDLETWSLAALIPPEPVLIPAERMPAAGARVLARSDRRVYALARHVYRSEDGGRSWTNITAFGEDSVIGAGQHDVAVSPRDPDLVVVANDYGVWRSTDGGLSWSGLNQLLPNLPVRRILATPRGVSGVRVRVEGLGIVEHQPGGGPEWHPVRATDEEAEARRVASASIGADITAVAGTGEIRYAGSADGRLWVSTDRGRTWRHTPASGSGPVASLWVDPQDPRVALAALASGEARILRTTNTGVLWDDITANLPDGPAHAVTADRVGRAVYAAAGSGVFLMRVDLDGPSPPGTWASVTDSLPRAAATDVRLDPNGNQLYVALDGYGVYATAAPHRAGLLRLVNAADFSTRPAAPGSLLSVLGGRVTRARTGELNVPVLDASDRESQVQVPFEVTGSSLAMALESAGRTVNLGLPLQDVSPAIFIDPEGSPMLLDADSGLLLDARNPARSGARIQILATGLGRVRPDWPTGLAAPLQQVPVVRAAVTAYLDRAPMPVTRATLAPGYIGLYLIEVTLPALVNAGPAELYVAAGGQESNRVRIWVEP